MLEGHQDRLELLHRQGQVLEHILELVGEELVGKLVEGERALEERRTEEQQWPLPREWKGQQSTERIAKQNVSIFLKLNYIKVKETDSIVVI